MPGKLKLILTLVLAAGLAFGGWEAASWYYGRKIATLQRDQAVAVGKAVQAAVAESKRRAAADRQAIETRLSQMEASHRHFQALKGEVRRVKTHRDCSIDPELVRVWNRASRAVAAAKAGPPGAAGVHAQVPGTAAAQDEPEGR